MNSGKYDREITVKRKSTTQSSTFGTQVVTFEPLVTEGSPPVAVRFPANVQDVMPSRAELVQQGLNMSRNPVRIRMRYRADIDSSMMIVLHGDSDVNYQIIGGPAEIGGRKRELELLCERFSS